MFNNAKLTPSVFSDSIVSNAEDPKSSRINLVQMNARITDCHKIWNILLFKEAFEMKEKKPNLNIGLKAYINGITTVLN